MAIAHKILVAAFHLLAGAAGIGAALGTGSAMPGARNQTSEAMAASSDAP